MKKSIIILMISAIVTIVLSACGNSVDKEFLADMEESIKYRMETTANEDYDSANVVNTELAYVEKYKDADFKDKELKELADKYIEGLLIQEKALKKEEIYEYQVEWQKGIVYRYEALNGLYNDYDFLEDDPKFVGAYISQYEDQKELLNAYNAIEKDLGEQFEKASDAWGFDGYSVTCTFKNNTEYTYSTTYVVKFFDKKGTMYETNETYIENIKPGTSYVVSVGLSDGDRCDHFDWVNYYDDVIIK